MTLLKHIYIPELATLFEDYKAEIIVRTYLYHNSSSTALLKKTGGAGPVQGVRPTEICIG